MIVEDRTRKLPEVWTDELCVALFEHARNLGRNGNPGGYILTVNLFPYVGIEEKHRRYLKPHSQWDYVGIRNYITHHPEEIALAWRRVVRKPW